MKLYKGIMEWNLIGVVVISFLSGVFRRELFRCIKGLF